jgi:hypothetical protein
MTIARTWKIAKRTIGPGVGDTRDLPFAKALVEITPRLRDRFGIDRSIAAISCASQ